MNKMQFNLVNGTSALKPECSRYSNENERIIDFASAAQRHYCGQKAEVRKPMYTHGKRCGRSNQLKGRRSRQETANRAYNAGLQSSLNLEKNENCLKYYGLLYTLAALLTIGLSAI